MFRLCGLFVIMPITMILTVSFFVLFAIQKTDKKSLQSFGKVIAILLWICAGLICSVGLYVVVTGHHPMMSVMKQMCGDRGRCMMRGDKCEGMMKGGWGECCKEGMKGKDVKDMVYEKGCPMNKEMQKKAVK